MSIFVLVLTLVLSLWIANLADAFPQVLWGWVHWPRWLLGLLGLALFSWCMDGEDG